MIDRDEALRILASIQSNADVAAVLLMDPTLSPAEQELELATRMRYVAARMARLEAMLLSPERSNLHVLGERDPERTPAA